MQYVAYYHMTDMLPDLPVQVTADNMQQAMAMFAKWRDRKESEGYGHLFDPDPFKVELDDFDPFHP